MWPKPRRRGWEGLDSCLLPGALRERAVTCRISTSALVGEGGPSWTQTSPTAVPSVPSVSHRNALVCSHDHLTLFLTLVSGLEFIRFDLDLVRPHALPLSGQSSGRAGGHVVSMLRPLREPQV